MIFNEKMMLDSFELIGTDEAEFIETVQEISKHTSREIKSMKGIGILSLRENGISESDIRFYIMMPQEPLKYRPQTGDYVLVPLRFRYESNFKNSKDYMAFVKEMEEGIRMMIWEEEDLRAYFVSENMINTFAQRIGVSVQKYKEASHERDLYTAKKMDVCEDATLIVRECNGIRKIFAMMGKSCPDTELSEILEVYWMLKAEYPDLDVRSWKINNFVTTVRVALPEYANELAAQYPTKERLLPCIELTTSDVGKSAFKARACWELENGQVFYDKASYTREHRGEMDFVEIAENIKGLYPEYEEFPRRMMDLETHDVKVATGANFQSLYKEVFKQAKLDTIIGKHREPTMKAVLQQELVGNPTIKASDVVWRLIGATETFRMNLPEQWKLDGETYRKYKDALADMPYSCFKRQEGGRA